MENKLKNLVYGGETPTIVDPDKYRQRFKKAMKKYFVGMCIQLDTSSDGNKQESNYLMAHYEDTIENEDSEENVPEMQFKDNIEHLNSVIEIV